MELDDAGREPERIAVAIHQQLGAQTGPVPVEDIAIGLDIVEIRDEPLETFEGCLITQPERADGAILVNGNAPLRRRRFTIAHELGHFLMTAHQTQSPSGFACRRADLILDRARKNLDLRQRQEAEANSFAINLLAPAPRCQKFLRRIPDLTDIVALSGQLDISREAASRRYVELHPSVCAAIFAKDGAVDYVCRHADFPFVALGRGHPLPRIPAQCGADGITGHEEADPSDWLSKANAQTPLVVQTLQQANKRQTILLAIGRE